MVMSHKLHEVTDFFLSYYAKVTNDCFRFIQGIHYVLMLGLALQNVSFVGGPAVRMVTLNMP